MQKMNNRGFTLIELLAALVILTAIMGIAIPSISSSLERTKKKQDDSKHVIFESAAELYVTDHKNSVYNILDGNSVNSCYISLDKLDLSEENLKDSDGNSFTGAVVFTRPNKYEYKDDVTGLISCY